MMPVVFGNTNDFDFKSELGDLYAEGWINLRDARQEAEELKNQNWLNM